MLFKKSKTRTKAKRQPKPVSVSATKIPKTKRPETRYITEREGARTEAQHEKMIKEARERIESELKKLQATENRPKSMAYFDNIARFYGTRVEEIKKFKSMGGKVIGTFCSFVPNEIILAAGALPVRLDCGFHEFIQPANDLLGDAGLCPLVRSTIGSKMLGVSPYLELCDMIVSPAPCDAKLKMAEVLQDYVPVHIMNVPRAKDRDLIKKQWIDEIVIMKKGLESFVKKKISVDRLKSSIRTYQEAQFVWRKFSSIRKKGNVLWGRDALLVAWLNFIDDVRRWTKNVKKLTGELETMLDNGVTVCNPDAHRIMLAGSPMMWPNWKLPTIIEGYGAIIVCDELCSGMRVQYDPVVVDEWTEKSMINALADRYLYPCTCPCFTPNLEREDNMLNRIREYKVDGVIYHVLKGCHINSFDATKTAKFLRENDVPMLKIESEYDVGDVGQIKVRVEAFLEMIDAKKGFM